MVAKLCCCRFTNTKPLFFEEMQDSMAYNGKSIRLIRSSEGFYFITTSGFKNVYVFTGAKSSLSLENKLLINEAGFKKPGLQPKTAVY
jgi:hypothetical protein